MDLTRPVTELGLTYRLKKSALNRLNIESVEDLLYHLPFRYEDYTNKKSLNSLKIDEVSTIQGTVKDIKNEYTKRHFVIQKATIEDGLNELGVTWFNQRFLTKIIKPGDKLGLVGKLEFFGKKRTFLVSDYEILEKTNGIHTTGFVPIYHETHGITSKWIRNRVYETLKNIKSIQDFLPEKIVDDLKMDSLYDAIYNCHFPKNIENAEKARSRLSFDELFLMHLSAIKRRDEWNKKNKGIPFKITPQKQQIVSFINTLPFNLTAGQLEATEQIKHDLQKDIPMNRLLEGDVGSGKTVVASIAMYIAYLNGYQSVLMAPTEVLANQHFKTLETFLKPMDLNIALITGSKKTHKEGFDIAVGTHALIQKNLNFEKLGLVVIDEQQRFGVEQRSILREKGKNPHFLTMTATPIPRTILLAMYKDLDVSYLHEMPIGRQKIKTWLVPNYKKKDGYAWVKKQIVDSKYQSQVFVVCPFIDESESNDTVKAAKSEFERLKKEDFKGLKLGLLHGKLKSKEKDQVLTDFKSKKTHVLVATPVVEVGIDIPDATIMVIEASDRFGLASLHQLRGRVGRGDKQSYCLLFTESETENVTKRLKYMETAHSGFELAEFDLKLRGGGDLFGTRQHGYSGFKIADFRNFELVEISKLEAEKTYPNLLKEQKLLEKVENVTLKLIHPD